MMKRRGKIALLLCSALILLAVLCLVILPQYSIDGEASLDGEILKRFSFRAIGVSIEKNEYQHAAVSKLAQGYGWTSENNAIYQINLDDETILGTVVVVMPTDGENSAEETFSYAIDWYRPYQLYKKYGNVDENRSYPDFSCTAYIRSQNGLLFVKADGASIDACIHRLEDYLMRLMPD